MVELAASGQGSGAGKSGAASRPLGTLATCNIWCPWRPRGTRRPRRRRRLGWLRGRLAGCFSRSTSGLRKRRWHRHKGCVTKIQLCCAVTKTKIKLGPTGRSTSGPPCKPEPSFGAKIQTSKVDLQKSTADGQNNNNKADFHIVKSQKRKYADPPVSVVQQKITIKGAWAYATAAFISYKYKLTWFT